MFVLISPLWQALQQSLAEERSKSSEALSALRQDLQLAKTEAELASNRVNPLRAALEKQTAQGEANLASEVAKYKTRMADLESSFATAEAGWCSERLNLHQQV